MSRTLPYFLKKCFWDIDFENFDFSSGKSMVIKRIMEHGDSRAVLWMRKNCSEDELVGVLSSTRDLSRRSANYWAIILGVNREHVKCLKTPFRTEQKKYWPY
jgi:hypothetical protein